MGPEASTADGTGAPSDDGPTSDARDAGAADGTADATTADVDATASSDASDAGDARAASDADDADDAGDAGDAGDGGPPDGGDASGATRCFDGAAPPSDWATVYNDLFSSALESKGNCGSGDCHGLMGGGPGNLTINPWTASATYQAFTRQQTNAPGNGILVDLDAGPASAALIGDPALTPLAWFGAGGNMPYDNPFVDPCAAAEVTAWLAAGAPGPVDDGGADAGRPDAGDAATPGKLTLALDPSLDTAADNVIATSITTAALLSPTGAIVQPASISQGKAAFDLTSVAAGDYFLEVNGDAQDLVPTRIEDPAAGVAQRVGRKLRASVIGAPGSPLYRIETWSAGQGESPVAQFSNGAVVAGEQAYVIVSYDPPNVEFRILGTAAPLTTFTPALGVHPSNSEPFDRWLLVQNGADGGPGPTQHGEQFNAETSDGGTPSCINCHTSYYAKPAAYSSIKPNNGWCFRCHYGPDGGDSNGFVDRSK
jgi:hypothetical protein